MIATTPALLVQPDGQVDVLDSHRPDQLRCPVEQRGRGVGDILGLATDTKDAATTCTADALEAAGPDSVPDDVTSLVVDFPEN
ncbi:hypothetical protein [Streptomyces lydicus]|uniref:hypothetical protein n=1 Tax=Streptomyces lydicus TaxID=47763 RepID=UPI0037931F08